MSSPKYAGCLIRRLYVSHCTELLVVRESGGLNACTRLWHRVKGPVGANDATVIATVQWARVIDKGIISEPVRGLSLRSAKTRGTSSSAIHITRLMVVAATKTIQVQENAERTFRK